MDLHRKGAGLGLALTVAGGFDTQLRKIVASNRVGQNDVDHRFAQRAVRDGQLDVHFGLPAEPGNTQSESPPVDPDSLAECVIALEDGSETEWEDGGIAEAAAYHASMLDG